MEMSWTAVESKEMFRKATGESLNQKFANKRILYFPGMGLPCIPTIVSLGIGEGASSGPLNMAREKGNTGKNDHSHHNDRKGRMR